ncbi:MULTISPECIES: hypothetical protein [unclassified Prochlorococcus]|uniref:hypothetical protein n=1 Tax=unclassified Prochlorococcus TaxID=2627481 RepID=UPI0012693C82|nr:MULTISPECIES: hypothetical protein [unclassified Prochlorococcus]
MNKHVLYIISNLFIINFLNFNNTSTAHTYKENDRPNRFIYTSSQNCYGHVIKFESFPPYLQDIGNIKQDNLPLKRIHAAKIIVRYPNSKRREEIGLSVGWGNWVSFNSQSFSYAHNTGGFRITENNKILCEYNKSLKH